MGTHLLLTDSLGHPCVVHGDAIMLATVDPKVAPKGAAKGTPTTLLILGEGTQIHVQETPEELYDELVDGVEVSLDGDDVEAEEDPEEVTEVVLRVVP